jgi:hypothetical protein
MSEDSPEEFRKKLDALKPKKKKLAVPEGFLDGAKSYEGKLEAVKIISEREKDRVVLLFKKMLEPVTPPPPPPEPKPEPPKPPEKKKGLFGKKK